MLKQPQLTIKRDQISKFSQSVFSFLLFQCFDFTLKFHNLMASSIGTEIL